MMPTDTSDIVTGRKVNDLNKVGKYMFRGCKATANNNPNILASNTVPINHLNVLTSAVQNTTVFASPR